MSFFNLIATGETNMGTLVTDLLFAFCAVVLLGRFDSRPLTLLGRLAEALGLYVMLCSLDVLCDCFGVSGYPGPTLTSLFATLGGYALLQLRLTLVDRAARAVTFMAIFALVVVITRTIMPATGGNLQELWFGYSVPSVFSYVCMIASALFIRRFSVEKFRYVPWAYVILLLAIDVLGAFAGWSFVELHETYDFFDTVQTSGSFLVGLSLSVSKVNIVVCASFVLLVVLAYSMFYVLAREHDQRAEALVSRRNEADSVANFGRVWLIAGSQASAATPFADSYLTYFAQAISGVFADVAAVVCAGADFSGYAGNVVALVASGVLCYLFGGLLTAEGTLAAVSDQAGLSLSSEKDVRVAKAVNAATNVVAPFLGCSGVQLSPVSAGGAQDRGRSGLATIVAVIPMLVSLFVLLLPALFATDVYDVTSMNQWNYFAYGNGGIVYLLRGVTLGVADVVLACVGVSMALCLRRLSGAGELVPAVVMAAASALTLNLVAGVACGMLVYLVMAVPARAKDPQALTVPMVVLEVLLVVAFVLL